MDTKALRVIRDQSHDEAVRDKFKTFYQENHVLSGELVADSLGMPSVAFAPQTAVTNIRKETIFLRF